MNFFIPPFPRGIKGISKILITWIPLNITWTIRNQKVLQRFELAIPSRSLGRRNKHLKRKV
jgi:hypothetical protein